MPLKKNKKSLFPEKSGILEKLILKNAKNHFENVKNKMG